MENPPVQKTRGFCFGHWGFIFSKRLLNKALKRIGIKIKYQGEGVNEVGIVTENNDNANVSIGQEIIKIDPRYYRPTEVDSLTGDYSKAKTLLNWKPKYTLDEIIDEMIEEDLENFRAKVKKNSNNWS